ncbi:MAG: TRAP transporter small permease [Burkholderiaceae bacterium]
MNRTYQHLRRWMQYVDTAAAYIACLLLFSLMLVVMADVSLRYLFNAPLLWSYEVISVFLLPGLFFLSVSHALGTHAHVSVDILQNYVSDSSRYVFEAITSAVATPVFAFIAWVALQQTLEQFAAGTFHSSGLELPSWLTTALLPLGFGLLALRCLLNTVGYAMSLVSGEHWLALPPLSGSGDDHGNAQEAKP